MPGRRRLPPAAAQTKAFDGTLTLYVGLDGKIVTVRIELPVDGGWGKNWPYDCPKSKKLTEAVPAISTSSGPAVAEAVKQQRVWLKSGPREQKAGVLSRGFPAAEVEKRRKELEGIGARPAKP